jgi:hypothetical protein
MRTQYAIVLLFAMLTGCPSTTHQVSIGQYVWVSAGSAASLNDIRRPIAPSNIELSAGPACPPSELNLAASLDGLDGRMRRRDVEPTPPQATPGGASPWLVETGGFIESITHPSGDYRVYTTNAVSITAGISATGGVPVSASSETTVSNAELLIVHYRRRADVSSRVRTCFRAAILEQRCRGQGRPDEVLGRVLSSVIYGGLARARIDALSTDTHTTIRPGELVSIDARGAINRSSSETAFIGNFGGTPTFGFDQLNAAFARGDAPAAGQLFNNALVEYALVGFGYIDVTRGDCPGTGNGTP